MGTAYYLWELTNSNSKFAITLNEIEFFLDVVKHVQINSLKRQCVLTMTRCLSEMDQLMLLRKEI